MVIKTKRQLSKIYDTLYARAVRIIKKHNPCEVKKKNGKAICLECRVPRKDWWYDYSQARPNTLCCIGCRHHTPIGCIAEKPLNCKIWLCDVARKKYPKVAEELDRIKDLASDFWCERGDKSTSLKEAINGIKAREKY